MATGYGSEVLAAVHETALGMAEAGVISKRTMREFDEMCLTPVAELLPEEIRALRLRENASQAVFARHLNVTALTLRWAAETVPPSWGVGADPGVGAWRLGVDRARVKSAEADLGI